MIPPAADRHQDDVEIGDVAQQLETARSLARDDPFVIVGRHDGQPFIGEVLARQDDARAEGLRAPHSRERRVLRHDDRRRNAQARGLVCNGLSVVAGGHRDHAALALVLVELQQRFAAPRSLKEPVR